MPKPTKTLADYLVVSISPVLIMLLVGSLSFFLVEVFFRGGAVGSVRWVMFWFVMAVVLVSRIGIEQGVGHAAVYGLGLAAATWLYLLRIHPDFILGAILLGIVWWCAHKLTWDCTLIDENEDASGGGLLQTAANRKNFLPRGKKATKIRGKQTEPLPQTATPHSPGLWVVYFSLAALPLFGIGQMLLPGDAVVARHRGFALVFVYVATALGLLLTTSFLGLRRYLRQRFLPMPGLIAFGWIRFGAGVAAVVLVGALLLPRPGANDAWQALSYHLDYQLRQASEYAARFSPHGKGQGRSGNETQNSEPSGNPTAGSQAPAGSGESPDPGPGETAQSPPAQTPLSAPAAAHYYRWFKVLFLLALAGLAGWWLFRQRHLFFQIMQSLLASIIQFFKDLFHFGSSSKTTSPAPPKWSAKKVRFDSYENPFLSGQSSSWTNEQLVLYSFEALQAWADEHEFKPRPEHTAREFCVELSVRLPGNRPGIETVGVPLQPCRLRRVQLG